MQAKISLKPNTTLYPVPVVLVTCGSSDSENVFTVNRVISCNAEPPMIGIAVRPSRASHDLIDRQGEFVVNIPWPDMETVSDFVGTTTIEATDKWAETGLTRLAATHVGPPLLAECPVNLECRVTDTVRLPSHSLFIAEVVAMHADSAVLDQRGQPDFDLARGGLPYRAGQVREKPVAKFNPEALRQKTWAWRDSSRSKITG